jgi:hypothetical protein
MSDMIPSKLAKAKLSEKEAWQRYAAAKGDDWREAFAKWVEARDASMAAWADEVTSRGR